ncbi:ATP-dependent Clp protease, protease subunit, partial [Monoraphidium neglectum]
MDQEQDICWICLGGPEGGELFAPCHCPRLLHPECLARWQLRRLSQQEGTHCRFCSAKLPAWTRAAPPEEGASLAIVSIHVAGKVHQVSLPPGAEGAAAFKQQVEAITGAPFSDEMCLVSFVCRDPFDPKSTITLEGINQFDHAMHCALISARGRAEVAGGSGADAGSLARGCAAEGWGQPPAAGAFGGLIIEGSAGSSSEGAGIEGSDMYTVDEGEGDDAGESREFEVRAGAQSRANGRHRPLRALWAHGRRCLQAWAHHSSAAAGTLRPQQRRAPFGATRVRAALWTPPGSDEEQPQQQEQPRGLDRPWVVRAEQQTAAPPRDLRGDPMGVLLRQRIIFLGGEVEDFGADSLVSQLLMLDQQDPGKDIKLFINSPGGSVTAGMGIYDAMHLCRSDVQ